MFALDQIISGEVGAADWLFLLAFFLFVAAAIVTATKYAGRYSVLVACGLAAAVLGWLIL